MYNLAIRKCTSPPLLAPRLKIFKWKFTNPLGIEPQTCWTRGRHATIWASTASKSQLILQPFHWLTYVTAHSPTLLLLLLCHRLFTYFTRRTAYGLLVAALHSCWMSATHLVTSIWKSIITNNFYQLCPMENDYSDYDLTLVSVYILWYHILTLHDLSPNPHVKDN